MDVDAAVDLAGDPAGPLATVLPGRGYGPQAPLLHYAAFLLRARGWAVRTLRWERVAGLDAADPVAVAAVCEAVLDGADPARDVVVGKSLGSLALPAAARRGLPGVWLTPLLAVEEVRRAAATTAAPTLLVGGAADPYWDGAAVAATGCVALEVPAADHSLEVPGDLEATLAALRAVLAAVADHLDALTPGARPSAPAGPSPPSAAGRGRSAP